MKLQKAWAVYEWKVSENSLVGRRLLWVASSEVTADSDAESASDGFRRTREEVVVAVDGDQCTILGKWKPVELTR